METIKTTQITQTTIVYTKKDPVNEKNAQLAAQYVLDSLIDKCLFHLTTPEMQFLYNRRELKDIKPRDSDYTFRMMSYNILADSLCEHTTDHFDDFELKYIEWKHRSAMIKKEVAFHSPDIICFQEIDRADTILLPSFESEYQIITKYRTGTRSDGLAILFRKSKFELIDYKYIEFKIEEREHPLLTKDNVAMFTVLRIKSDDPAMKKKLIIVSNIHVLFNENRGDIKITQMYLALKSLYLISQKYKAYDKMLFLAGDFNSTPNSALYSWLTNGDFDFYTVRTNEISGQKRANCMNMRFYENDLKEFVTNLNSFFRPMQKYYENRLSNLMQWIKAIRLLKLVIDAEDKIKIVETFAPPETIPEEEQLKTFDFCLRAPLRMTSAYASFQRYYYKYYKQAIPPTAFKPYSTYENLITSIPPNGPVTVDYIWFLEIPAEEKQKVYHKLRVSRLVEMPLIENLSLLPMRYPQKFFPSDHFSLVVDFTFD